MWEKNLSLYVTLLHITYYYNIEKNEKMITRPKFGDTVCRFRNRVSPGDIMSWRISPWVSGLTVNQNSTSTSSRLTIAQMAHADELCSVSCRGKRLIKHTCVFAHWRRRYLGARGELRAPESRNEHTREIGPRDRRAETITGGRENEGEAWEVC